MPFQKSTKKRGRKPEKDGYNTLNDVEKKKYHKAVKEFRADDPSTSLLTTSTSSPHTPKKKSTGSPPITGATAMTPTTLRNRKRYTMKVKRKTERQKLIPQASRNPDNSTTDDSDPEVIVPDEEADTAVGETASTPATSKKHIYRRKCKLRGILVANAFDNMRLLIMYQKESGFHHGLKELEKVDLSAYTIKPFRYRRRCLHKLFSSRKNDVKIELIKYWLDIILKNPAVRGQLQRFNVIIPEELIPRSVVVSKIASTIAKQFLTPSSKGSHERRRNSIQYVIRVAKEAKLSEGDGNVLSSNVNCCGKFASKVLKKWRTIQRKIC